MGEGKLDHRHPTEDELSRYRQIAIGLLSHPQAGPFELQVISDSMQPFLRPGDLIQVESPPGKVLQRGDIIVRLEVDSQTRSNADWIVHRLVGKTDRGWLTKGDNRWAFDPPVAESAILGRVIQIYHQARWIDVTRFPWDWLNRSLGLYNYGLGIIFTRLHSLWGRLKSVKGVKKHVERR